MSNLQCRVKIVQCFSISSRELHSARARGCHNRPPRLRQLLAELRGLLFSSRIPPPGFRGVRQSCSHTGNGTLDVIFFRAEDWFSHTLDHVGDKFVHMHIDGFWNLWINIFRMGKTWTKVL